MPEPADYPATPADRTQWITQQRPARNPSLDPRKPYAFLVEEECSDQFLPVPIATIFLTNRECPWHCLMCDLWKNTLTASLPPGAIPAQIDHALSNLPPARHIKLYNSGSFFDPHAIPTTDHPAIAQRLAPFERTIVECHPALLGASALRFRDLLHHPLEVAIGLETAHPETLSRLNKGLTVPQFTQAARFLHRHNIALRVFILVQPPFLPPSQALHWAQRSLDLAFDCGATAATLIPTRAGNGAMETLARQHLFTPPNLATVEAAALYGLSLQKKSTPQTRIFVDLWDMPNTPHACPACLPARIARLHTLNLHQTLTSPIPCPICGEGQ